MKNSTLIVTNVAISIETFKLIQINLNYKSTFETKDEKKFENIIIMHSYIIPYAGNITIYKCQV